MSNATPAPAPRATLTEAELLRGYRLPTDRRIGWNVDPCACRVSEDDETCEFCGREIERDDRARWSQLERIYYSGEEC